ncbi:MAG: hypothetical protein WCK98_08195 [bacterium]
MGIISLSILSLAFFDASPDGAQRLPQSPSEPQLQVYLPFLIYVLGCYIIIPFITIEKNKNNLIKFADQAWHLFKTK